MCVQNGYLKKRKRKFNSHFLLFCTKDAVRALYTALRNVSKQKNNINHH